MDHVDHKGELSMRKITVTFAANILVIFLAGIAQALPNRTFVSVGGDDANNCTHAAPCRTFGGAQPKTAPGGEITALGSGAYGTVVITQALTIQGAPGVYAALGNDTSNSPVTVSAGTRDVVVLRNLTISRSVSGSPATRGIDFQTALALHIEGCVVTGFPDAGLFCSPPNPFTPILVKDSLFRENGVAMNIGNVNASIDHCRIEHNRNGIFMETQSRVTVRDSVVASNAVGLLTDVFEAIINLENCMVTNNGIGIQASVLPAPQPPILDTKFYVSNTMIVANNTGLNPNGGEIISFGNNRLANNVIDGSFTSTIAQQ
jgi:hypothetical protein